MPRKQVNPKINLIARHKAANQLALKESAFLNTSRLAAYLGNPENRKVLLNNQNNKGE